MGTYQKIFLFPKRTMTGSRMTLGKTLRSVWLLQWILLFLVLVPCLTFSQEIENEQEMATRLQELVNKSEIIVDAQVISKESRWINDERGKGIYTIIKFKVFRTIKGVVESSEFTFDQPGGTVNDTTSAFYSSKPYNLNERAIYYFRNKNLNTYLCEEGRYSVDNGKVYIRRQAIDVDRYVNVLKQSLTDKSAIPAFMEEVKEKEGERLSIPGYEGTRVTSKEHADPNKKKPGEGWIVSPNVIEPKLNKSGSQDTIVEHKGDPILTKKDKKKASRNNIRDSVLTPRGEEKNP